MFQPLDKADMHQKHCLHDGEEKKEWREVGGEGTSAARGSSRGWGGFFNTRNDYGLAHLLVLHNMWNGPLSLYSGRSCQCNALHYYSPFLPLGSDYVVPDFVTYLIAIIA